MHSMNSYQSLQKLMLAAVVGILIGVVSCVPPTRTDYSPGGDSADDDDSLPSDDDDDSA